MVLFAMVCCFSHSVFAFGPIESSGIAYPSGVPDDDILSYYTIDYGIGRNLNYSSQNLPFLGNNTRSIVSLSLIHDISLINHIREYESLTKAKNGFKTGRYWEYGLGGFMSWRYGYGEQQQTLDAVNKIDSSIRSISAMRSSSSEFLNVGLCFSIGAPSYILERLRMCASLDIGMIVKSSINNSIVLAEQDSVFYIPYVDNVTYTQEARKAQTEQAGILNCSMCFSLKYSLSYTIPIFLRYTIASQFAEVQPYVEYGLNIMPSLSERHELFSSIQIGVRMSVPTFYFYDERLDFDYGY